MDTPCLELEFERFRHPVSFPTDDQIEKFAQLVSSRNPMHRSGSSSAMPFNVSTNLSLITEKHRTCYCDTSAETIKSKTKKVKKKDK